MDLILQEETIQVIHIRMLPIGQDFMDRRKLIIGIAFITPFIRSEPVMIYLVRISFTLFRVSINTDKDINDSSV